MKSFNGKFEIPIGEDFLVDVGLLSEEERKRANLVGEVVELYVKTHHKNTDPDKIDYGKVFDKFYDKKLNQLKILKEMYKL